MPRGKKVAGRDFLPGNPGGPGRPPDPPELKEIKRLTKGELELLITKMMHVPLDQLDNFQGTVLEVWLAAGIRIAIKTGDFSRLNFLLERVLGKVPDKTEFTGRDGGPLQLTALSNEELAARAATIEAKLKLVE